VIVESMIRTSYPASSNGVEIAKIPSGAVASMLENDATKNTILLEDFTAAPLGPSGKKYGRTQIWHERHELVNRLK
jgi:hypothetical protein